MSIVKSSVTEVNAEFLPRVRFFSRRLLFLVYLPIFHFVFVHLILLYRGPVNWQFSIMIALTMWAFSAATLMLVALLEKWFLPRDSSIRTLPFVLKYFLPAMVLVLLLHAINVDRPERVVQDTTPVGPLVIILFEVLLSAAIRYILIQQSLNNTLALNFKTAQLQALRAQVNPHFLFNTLNLISTEIDQKPGRASSIVDTLADLMHGSLAAAERPLITLDEELKLIEHYLQLQQMRFGERLQYSIENNGVNLSNTLPPMLLQPLVENSIVHGLSPHKDGGTVRIKLGQDDEAITIWVSDDGEGFDPTEQGFGHGLSIVRDNIKLLYSNNPELGKRNFHIESVPEHGTVVTLRLPINQTTLGPLRLNN